MTVSPSKRRVAHISFAEKGSDRAVRVSYPGKLSGPDVGRIEKALIDDVIKGLTGCSCLSGVIPVIWEPDYAQTIQVNLEVRPG